MILEERTVIEASPEDVFRFFEQLDDDSYRDWHPDHVTFQWIEGQGLEPDAVAYFEEIRGEKDIKMTVQYRRVEPNRYIEFAPTSRMYRLFLPRMSFQIEPHERGSELIAQVQVRVGPIGARLNRGEFDVIRKHMREEGENLKQTVENRLDQSASEVTADY